MGNPVIATFATLQGDVTPYAMAKISDDLYFRGCIDRDDVDFYPLVNFLLLSASIEVGLKSIILSNKCTKEVKQNFKKNIGHNLISLLDYYHEVFSEKIYSDEEVSILESINSFYQKKGLEYFTLPVMMSAMKGFKDFPDIGEYRRIAMKVNDMLRNERFLISS